MFACFVVTVNDEHTKFKLKLKLRVKFKDGTCVELCLKLWFEIDWYFCNITESGWFWKRLSRSKVPNNLFPKSIEKVTVKKFIVELWTVISNEIIKYQVPFTRFEQISGHKYYIYLYGKLSSKLYAQAANKS